MAVERCSVWRCGFLVFCIAPKGATTKVHEKVCEVCEVQKVQKVQKVWKV